VSQAADWSSLARAPPPISQRAGYGYFGVVTCRSRDGLLHSIPWSGVPEIDRPEPDVGSGSEDPSRNSANRVEVWI